MTGHPSGSPGASDLRHLSLSVTGVAGPFEEEGKPIGLVYMGAEVEGWTDVRELRLGTGRASNHIAAVESAIDLGIEVLDSQPSSAP